MTCTTEKNSLYRERFACTLAHQSVDRCPIDLGGTPQSTIEDPETETRLAALLGFSGSRPNDYDKLDRRILAHFDVDFRRVGGIVPFKTGRERRAGTSESTDCFGIRSRFDGHHWHIVDGPLQYANLNAVRAYDFPILEQILPGILEEWEVRARRLFEETPFVVVGEHPVFGVLELACWLAGYDHVMLKMAEEPEWIALLFEKILSFQKMVIHAYYQRLGRYLHLTTSGDDFGAQQGLFMSPAMFQAYVKPCMRERIDFTRRFTEAVYMHHTCGAVFDIVPDLIDTGVRILNPIQPRAKGMDPARLKAVYGRDLVFHGGLDTQEVLPSNNHDTIECAVNALLKVMNPRATGGYIFAPAHNIQRDVSPDSILWMYEAVLRHDGWQQTGVEPWNIPKRAWDSG